MRVAGVTFVGRDLASVRLRPSFLRRLFGARDLVYELEYDHGKWVGFYTRDPTSHMTNGSLLTRALEAQPVVAPPRAQQLIRGLSKDGP